jgi:hypothetical protein
MTAGEAGNVNRARAGQIPIKRLQVAHCERRRAPVRGFLTGKKKDGGPKPAVQYHVAVETAVDQNFAERLKNT